MQNTTEKHTGPQGKRCGLRLLLCALAALLSSFALGFELNKTVRDAKDLYSYLTAGLDGRRLLFSVLFLALFALYYRYAARRRGTPFLLTAAVLGFFFALFAVLGRCFTAFDDWSPLLASGPAALVTLLSLAGLWVLFYAAIKTLLLWTDRRAKPAPHPAPAVPGAKAFWLVFGVLLAAWLPYLLLCWPGSVTYDGANQLSQYLGATPATAHHPWASTLLLGLPNTLCGGSVTAGVFLYVVFQSLVCAAAYAWTCVTAGRFAGRRAILPALLYFAVLPTWGSYAQMYVKDTLYAGFFAVFFTAAAVFAARRGAVRKGTLALLAVSALVCTLIRNNGAYAVIPALLLLLPAARRGLGRRFAFLTAAAALAVLLLFNHVLLPAWGVAPGSVREALSLPFQQTARCCIEHPEDVSDEERAAIDAVLDYETIVAQYKPRVSDNVKNTYHGDREALAAYLGVWLRMGLRHPLTYCEAALNACFGYLAPGYLNGKYGGGYYGAGGASFGIEAPRAFPALTELVKRFNIAWSKLPGLGALMTPSSYTWLLALCTAALLRKKRFRAAAALVCLWITLAINCVSPVNGLLRYTLPLMAAAPLLCAYTLAALRTAAPSASPAAPPADAMAADPPLTEETP